MSRTSSSTGSGIARRTFVKLAGLGLAGSLLAGTAAAHPKPTRTQSHHYGETVSVGDGTVRTFATTNPAGNLSSIGIHIDGDALTAFENGDFPAHPHHGGFAAFLDLPAEAQDSPFTVMGFDFGPEGHEPATIYDVPHFDIHFHMLPEAQVDAIGPFPHIVDYDIPADQLPPNNVTAAAVGQPRVAIPDMGEHLVDLTAPEIQHLLDPTLEPVPFTHTLIWGAYDPALIGGSGDGVGQINFVEPMVTLEYLQNLDGEAVAPILLPEVFVEAGDYPTEYVMKPDHSGGVYVFIDGFEEVPAA